MRTWPAPGEGSGTSSTFITSGPPNARTTIAFMRRFYREPRNGPGAAAACGGQRAVTRRRTAARRGSHGKQALEVAAEDQRPIRVGQAHRVERRALLLEDALLPPAREERGIGAEEQP